MSDVIIKYSNQSIDSLSATGIKTLQTSGKYCESDFTVEYTKPTHNLQSKTVSPQTTARTVTPDIGYDGLSQVTVSAMPSGSTTQNAPTINTSTGLVTATATVVAGYQATSTKTNTLQLTTQAAQIITPTTTDQTIASGKYLTGAQTIKGDADLVPANIKNGVSIFNVTGTGMTDVVLTQDSNGVVDIPNAVADVNNLVLQTKNVTPSAAAQNVAPDNGYYGLSRVGVAGDANLVPANIAQGVSIFGVQGTHSGGGVTDISSLLAISDGESPYSASSIKQLKGYKIGDTFYVVAALSPDLENGGYGVVIEAEDLPTEGYQFYMSVSSAAYYELYDEYDGPSYYVVNGVDEVDTEFHNSNPGSFRAVIDIDSNAPEGGVLVVNLCFLLVDY